MGELAKIFQCYAVANKGKPNEQRVLLGMPNDEGLARGLIRDAIASGFDYGYIKQGFETVAYLTEESFLGSRRLS